MSEHLYAEPGIIKREDDKERIVDIYVSAESLKVYDNPWVDGTKIPNIPGPPGPQYPGMDTTSVSNKRVCKHNRADFILFPLFFMFKFLFMFSFLCGSVHSQK